MLIPMVLLTHVKLIEFYPKHYEKKLIMQQRGQGEREEDIKGIWKTGLNSDLEVDFGPGVAFDQKQLAVLREDVVDKQ